MIILIGKVSLGIQGSIKFWKSSDAKVLPAADVTGRITGYVEINILSILKASAYVGFTARFFNLGPSFSGSDADDDEFEVTGRAEFTATVCWFFKIKFSTKIDLVKRRALWDKSPNEMSSGHQDALKGCSLVSTHDRKCPGSQIRITGFAPWNGKYGSDHISNRDTVQYYNQEIFDKRDGSKVYRSTTLETAVSWDCESSRGSLRRRRNMMGFRRRRGAKGNRVVMLGDTSKTKVGFSVYECPT
ncbi:unnamed protein product [Effrenium voratum]|uniref:Uncharacterized protein n=1 Tax=Effrenium voratum TaxID=2562239 RepID=A0AA36MYW6_9DINO|nr:unnamed protein product [Effrenium voratum]CAJ1431982.1 unnamed protein product [Effrenium voratum]CAJ1451307.1 unnamed protein product [Effrenium voratum]